MNSISSQTKKTESLTFSVHRNVTKLKMSYRTISLKLQIFTTKSFREERSADVSGGGNHDRNSGLKKAHFFLTNYTVFQNGILLLKVS